MTLCKKILISIFILIISMSYYKCYGLNGENIEFNIKNNNYHENFYTLYKEIEINNVAPGTNGTINIKINNYNDNIKYFLRFLSEENKPTNMKFSFGNKEYNSLLELNNFLSGSMNDNEEKTIQIKYNWNYETGLSKKEIENNDEIDTLDNNKIFRFVVELEIENDIIEKSNNPKTGDNILIYVMLFIFSIIGISILEKINDKKLD